MGKDKNLAEKVVMPSTTRGGKDLPSRPKFSPNAASAVSSKRKMPLYLIHHCLSCLRILIVIYQEQVEIRK
jgi:hypothetical protein